MNVRESDIHLTDNAVVALQTRSFLMRRLDCRGPQLCRQITPLLVLESYA